MKLMRRTIAFLWACSCLAAAGSTVAADDVARVEPILNGARSNYAAFDAYSCTMQVRCGTAASLEEALSSGPSRDVVEGQATLLVDKAALCYRLTSNDTMRMDPTGTSGTMVLPGEVILADERHYMSDGFIVSLVDHPDADQWAVGPDITTFNGAGGLAEGHRGRLENFLPGFIGHGAELVMVEDVERRGVATTQIEVTWEAPQSPGAGSKNVMTFFVDPARGYLPLETESGLKGVMHLSTFITDIQEFPGRGWFPMRAVAVWTRQDGQYFVREVVVTDLKLARPAPEAFFIPVGPALEVRSPSPYGLPSRFEPKEGQIVTLAQLPEFYESMVRGAPLRVVPTPAGPGIPTWLLALNATLVVALVAACIALLRRRPTAVKPPPSG